MTSLFRVTASTTIALAGATLLLLARSPQDPPAQPPIFRTGVDLVRVDVSVTGRDDQAMTDLQASDFEIKEDDVLQRVETVQFIRVNGTRTSDTNESLEIRSPEHAALEAARGDVRVFAIFLDDYHVEKDQQVTLRVRQALKDYVKLFGPNDIVAVMDPLTPLSSLKFTRSRDDLLLRMNQFEGRRGQVFPVKSVLEEGQLQHPRLWELRGEVSLSALEALVTYLGGLGEGRKSVLFVSQGPTMNRFDSSGEARVRAVLQAANRGNVTIHVFDPRPLGSVKVGGADVLSRLASETGGRAIVNANEPAARLAQTVADASAYYLVGYTPTRTVADGKFHKIEVKVKRGGARVMARRGYWAEAPEEMRVKAPAKPAEPGLASALAELVEPKIGRALDFWVGTSRGASGMTRLTIAWEPVARPGAKPAVELAIEPLDGGATRPPAREAAEASPRGLAEPQAIAPSSTAAFEFAPGTRVNFRFTARGADGVVDRWDQPITVPGLVPLALSTPRFLRARSPFEVRALEAGHEPVPAASRRFRSSDRVFVDVEWYSASGAPADVNAHLLNAKGDPLLDLPTPGQADGRTRITLPLASLAKGMYVLRVEARVAADVAQQRVAFQIVP